MRRIVIALAILASSVLSGSAAAAGGYRVCLDPGHGGTDPGAVRGSLVEKELTLDIAQRVAAALTPLGHDVKLTRTDNATTLGNSARAAICNGFAAQVELSIHLNASSDPAVDYVWFFYGKRNKDLAYTRTLDQNYVISSPDGVGSLPHKAITNFANGTLLKTNAPSALVECLFLSNTDEQRLLAQPDPTDPAAPSSRRQQIANALVTALRAYTKL